MTDGSDYLVIPALALAAGSCLWASIAAFRWRGRKARPSETIHWGAFAAIFLAFIVMKFGSVVAAVDDLARGQLRREGIYENRRMLQVVALCAVALVIAVGIWQVRRIAGRWQRYRWTVIGSFLIIAFGIIRAISLHEIDALGTWRVMLKIGVEGGGGLLAATSPLMRVRQLGQGGGNDG